MNKLPLTILKLLLLNPMSKEDIMEVLNIKSPTFYKHLSQIKKAGFKVEKEKNLYSIKEFQNVLHLASFEKSLIAYMKFLCFYLLPDFKIKKFNSIINKILCFSDKNTNKEIEDKYILYKTKSLKSEFKDKINVLQKFIDEKKNIILILSSGRELEVIPQEFDYSKEKVYLNYFHFIKRKNSAVNLEKIVKIIPRTTKNLPINAQETIFELYGKLSKSYLLRNEERIIDGTKDKIIIANSSTDKTTLFKRLLRYDTFCKVIFPKEDVSEFRKMIKKSLENMDRFQDNSI